MRSFLRRTLDFSPASVAELGSVRPHSPPVKIKRYRYNIQHACFACRKVFKLPSTEKEQARSAWLSRRYLSGRSPTQPSPEFAPHRCPECSGTLEMLGRAFRAPRRQDRDAWERVRLLVQGGCRFFSYSSGGYPVESTREVREFLVGRRRQSTRAA